MTTRKAKALLVYLAMAAGIPQSRDHLASLLWGRSASEQAKASLRQTLSIMRKSLPADSIRVDGESVSLGTAAISIDAVEFENVITQQSVELLERSAELYRGDFLSGFELAERNFERWHTDEQHRLRELAIRHFCRLADHYESAQVFDSCVDINRKILALDPFQEKSMLSLMRSLTASDRRETAITEYRKFAKLVQQDLGIEVGEAARSLYKQILENSPPLENPPSATQIPLAVSNPVNAGPAVVEKSVRKPAVAVLPFKNLSGDESQDYFSDGISEDIIVELSRFRSITVFGRSSSFSLRNREADDFDMNKKALGADYFVEGSVRRSGSQIRISVQLVVAASGEQIWGQKFDRELRDIFAVQDEVTSSIVATLGGRMEEHRAIIRRSTSPNDWSIYDLTLKAQELHYRIQKQPNVEARRLLEQARAMDTDNARICSLLGAVQLLDYVLHWTEDPQANLQQALENGRKSIQLDNSDSLAHARLGETLIHFDLLSESEAHFRKALKLNPNDCEAIALYSIYFQAVGKPKESLRQLDKVQKLDPFDRVWIPWCRGETLLSMQRFEEAIAAFEEVTEPINDLRSSLAACYAQIGKINIARELLKQFIEIAEQETPLFPGKKFEDWLQFWKTSSPYRNEEQYQRLLKALAKAWPY
jgi:TolB-like protein/Flp pilus assembly protein TadD